MIELDISEKTSETLPSVELATSLQPPLQPTPVINITVDIPLRTLDGINLEVSNIFTIKDNNPPRLIDKLLDRINRREGKGISYEFIIDSSASVHTVCNKDLFLSTKSTNRRVA